MAAGHAVATAASVNIWSEQFEKAVAVQSKTVGGEPAIELTVIVDRNLARRRDNIAMDLGTAVERQPAAGNVKRQPFGAFGRTHRGAAHAETVGDDDEDRSGDLYLRAAVQHQILEIIDGRPGRARRAEYQPAGAVDGECAVGPGRRRERTRVAVESEIAHRGPITDAL